MAHNYLRKINKLIESGAIPPESKHIQVLHDDYCLINVGRDCNCDPDIELGNAEDMEDTIVPGLGVIQ
jgi:hypothetical protein